MTAPQKNRIAAPINLLAGGSDGGGDIANYREDEL